VTLPDRLSLSSSLFAPPQSAGLCLNLRHFSEPESLFWMMMGFRHHTYPGLYAILVPDNTWNPRPYRPIYFGEARNLGARVGESHEKYDHWCGAAGGLENLYVAFHDMMGSSSGQREDAATQLVRYFLPECNERDDRPREMQIAPPIA